MNFSRIDVAQARALMAADAQVVDIRDAHSFAAGAMPGAVHLHGGNVEAFLAEADPARPLIVCCYHGNSSQGAAAYFADKGFSQACSLDGGYEAWAASERGSDSW